jgi:5'-nucleotidase / UDP-sugar diphosphatase
VAFALSAASPVKEIQAMRITRLSALFLLSLVTLLPVPSSDIAAQNAVSGEFTLTILHTNDLHGHIFPFAYVEEGRSKVEMPSVGGAARRATLVRRLRREVKNPLLLVDSGDTFTRGPLTNAYEGIADVESMNAVGYDLAALGNNEFKAKDGYEVTDAAGAQNALLQVVKRARYGWLCANAKDGRGAFLEGVQPYVVREINGVRIGFLGLTAPRSATYPQTRGWTISDPIAAAKEWIPVARQHCDILIAMTHIGVDMDKQLAAETTGLDAIVGGDSHTFLYKAEAVANPEGRKIPIVQDGEFGVNVGRFDLKFARGADGHWTLTRYFDKLIPVGADIKEAPDVISALQPYLRPMLTVVGHLDKIGDTPAERTQITNRVITDAMRLQCGADLALNTNDSGFDVFRHTEVTRYDVYAILPFKNRVMLANLTGAEIQALQKTVANTVVSGSATPLDAGKTYKVAFVDYAAQSAYKLPETKLEATGRDLRDVVMTHLSHKPQP